MSRRWTDSEWRQHLSRKASTPSESEIRNAVGASGELYGRPDALERLGMKPETKPKAKSPKPKAEPAPSESTEQGKLSTLARAEWWGGGYRHIEQATRVHSENKRKHRQGVRPGWPDVVVIECRALHPLVALELKKRSDRPMRPKRPEWWLDWAEALERDPRWHTAPSEPTSHGLRAHQALQLLRMHRARFVTYVAYGHEDAIGWLRETMGPRP